MKEYFFMAVIGMVVLAGVSYFVWIVLKSVYTIYDDWKLGKELDEITAQARARRRQRRAAEQSEKDDAASQ